jgi:hypothetical protein
MQQALRKSLIVSGLALAAAAIGQTASANQDDVIHWQSVKGIGTVLR